MHEPLILEVGTHSKANILVQESLLHNWELEDCELFIEDCTMTQCYHWYRHEHTTKSCKGRCNCGHRAEEHASNSCPSSEHPATSHCYKYKGEHTAWSRLCPKRVTWASRAVAAYVARPSIYIIPAQLSPETSCPPSPSSFSPAPSPWNPVYHHLSTCFSA